jgi:hypothetical protein
MFKSDERKENRRKKAIVAVISVLLISLFLIQSVDAYPKLPPGPVSKTELEGYCNEHGGRWFPACGGNHYCCHLPDGTFIDCNGSVCEVSKASNVPTTQYQVEGVVNLQTNELNSIRQNDLAGQVGALLEGQEAIATQVNALQSTCTLPDLVPLPTPASTPPEGFCRRNDQGQLLVNVYNQGGANAVASTTRAAFNCADPNQCSSRSPIVIDVVTPALPAFTGIDLDPIDIPPGCFDPDTLNCNFRMGVDVNNVVIELGETNNNALGVCGPQFQ